MNCHGCKWLDETKKGEGYCSQVERSANYHTMPCAMNCGRRAPKVRRAIDEPCELYEPGEFATRYNT